MAPYHILIVIISSVIPEHLVLLTKIEQSGPKSAHIRPTRRRKAFYFCRLRPADSIVSGLLSYDDIFLTEGCRKKHLALIIRDKIRRT